MMEEIKNVTEQELVNEEVLVEETKAGFLTKVEAVAKKHGTKIAVVGVAVIGIAAFVAKALLKKDSAIDEYEETTCDEDCWSEEENSYVETE